MEHESNNSGSFAELPQPQEANNQAAPENKFAVQPEARGTRMPTSTAPQAQQPDTTITSDPRALLPTASSTPLTDQAGGGSAVLIADDADLIEKEWVIRAKAIVAQTKDDPHTQNREMNKVKADYLKKRYNKDLKTSEG